MSASDNSSAIPVEAGGVLGHIDSVGEYHVIYMLAAIILAAVVLNRFAGGRTTLQRPLGSLDSMLGGAPHTVALPGPPGFPLIGNLMQVGCF